jgi:hypothetical protein
MKVTHVANNQLKEYLWSSLPIRYGVPHGSILGPLLFILHVSDVRHLTLSRTIMHADDTSVLNIGQDINELQITTSENTGLAESILKQIMCL